MRSMTGWYSWASLRRPRANRSGRSRADSAPPGFRKISALHATQVVGLADLHAVMAQQVVRRRHVEEEVRDRPVAQEDQSRKGERCARGIDRDRARVRALELRGLEALQIIDRL